MEEKNIRVKRPRPTDGGRFRTPRFIQEWFYGPYQSLTSEQICLGDPEWLSEAISQEIMNGKSYSDSVLQKLAEINPEFSITLEAKKVIAERQAKWEAQRAAEKKERERIENLMAERELIFSAMSEEAKAAHNEQIDKLIGWWFNPTDVKLESGKYEGYTTWEILEQRTEDAVEDFSKAIVDHYFYLDELQLHWIKVYCPSFKLSDESAEINKYEKDALDKEIAEQEYLDDLAHEEHLRDLDSLGEPTEGSSEDWNDNLDLDQQHPDFYQG